MTNKDFILTDKVLETDFQYTRKKQAKWILRYEMKPVGKTRIEYTFNIYGSHLVVFINKYTTLIQFNTTQENCNSKCCFYTCYMFQPIHWPPSGMSLQKPYKGRYHKIPKAACLQSLIL